MLQLTTDFLSYLSSFFLISISFQMAENLFDWQPQPTNSPRELNNYFSLEFATQEKKKERGKDRVLF